MLFTRTNSGLSNLHLFYDADMVIFTEGGSTSFSIEDAEDGKHNKHSVDIKFWSHILSSNGYDKKVEFRALGSKTASNSLCEKILTNEIKNAAVARDRDLDEYLGKLMDSPFILYTKGYSWENDVFVKESTIDQVRSMLLSGSVPQEILDAIENAYKEFGIYGRNLAKLEIIFRLNGMPFISDLNGERFFNVKKVASIDKKQVAAVLSEKKKNLRRPVKIRTRMNNICPFFNNYGKLLESLSINIISYFCKKYAGYKSIPKQMLVSAMMERFAQKISLHRDGYYFSIVNNLSLACL